MFKIEVENFPLLKYLFLETEIYTKQTTGLVQNKYYFFSTKNHYFEKNTHFSGRR